MKKLLVFIGVILISIQSYAIMSGDTITLDQLPEATSVSSTDIFWIKAANVDKHIEAGNFLQWTLNGSDLYPLSTGTTVGIGLTNPNNDYILDIFGKVNIKGKLYLDNYVLFDNQCYIGENNTKLLFYSPSYGTTISLSELAQSATSLNSGNAITIDGHNNIDMGGSADNDIQIDMGTAGNKYNLYNYDNGYNRITLNQDAIDVRSNFTSLYGYDRFEIIGDSVQFGYSSVSGWYARDKRTGYNGWHYYGDYSDSLKTYNNGITSTLTVSKIIRDSLGNTFFEADTMRSSNYNTVYEGQFEADTFVVDLMAAVPSVAVEGMIVGLTDHTAKYYNGSSWDDLNITKSDAIDTVGLHSFDSLTANKLKFSDYVYMKDIGSNFYIYQYGEPKLNLHDSIGLFSHCYPQYSDSLWLGNTEKPFDVSFINKMYLDSINVKGAWFDSTDLATGAAGNPAGANYQFQYYNGGSFGASSNFGYSTDTDTINIFDWKVHQDAGNSLMYRYNNINLFRILTTGYFGGSLSNSPMMYYGNSISSPTQPSYSWQGDDNTGIAHPMADVVKILAGGDSTVIIYKDSMEIRDMLKLVDLTPSDTCVLIILPTGVVDTIPVGQVADDEFILEQIPFWEYQDHWQKNNRLKGMRETADINKFMNDLLRQVERNYMYDAELREELKITQYEVEKLKITQRLLIAIILLILIARYIRKYFKK